MACGIKMITNEIISISQVDLNWSHSKGGLSSLNSYRQGSPPDSHPLGMSCLHGGSSHAQISGTGNSAGLLLTCTTGPWGVDPQGYQQGPRLMRSSPVRNLPSRCAGEKEMRQLFTSFYLMGPGK